MREKSHLFLLFAPSICLCLSLLLSPPEALVKVMEDGEREKDKMGGIETEKESDKQTHTHAQLHTDRARQ